MESTLKACIACTAYIYPQRKITVVVTLPVKTPLARADSHYLMAAGYGEGLGVDEEQISRVTRLSLPPSHSCWFLILQYSSRTAYTIYSFSSPPSYSAAIRICTYSRHVTLSNLFGLASPSQQPGSASIRVSGSGAAKKGIE